MILGRSLSTAKVLTESNPITVLLLRECTMATCASARQPLDKLMETQPYSPYFPINCYFSTQRVGVRVERAE
jgi:hypothetical protein